MARLATSSQTVSRTVGLSLTHSPCGVTRRTNMCPLGPLLAVQVARLHAECSKGMFADFKEDVAVDIIGGRPPLCHLDAIPFLLRSFPLAFRLLTLAEALFFVLSQVTTCGRTFVLPLSTSRRMTSHCPRSPTPHPIPISESVLRRTWHAIFTTPPPPLPHPRTWNVPRHLNVPGQPLLSRRSNAPRKRSSTRLFAPCSCPKRISLLSDWRNTSPYDRTASHRTSSHRTSSYRTSSYRTSSHRT